MKRYVILTLIGNHWLVHTNDDSKQAYPDIESAERQVKELKAFRNKATGAAVWKEIQIIPV